jgi:hypothetical protein
MSAEFMMLSHGIASNIQNHKSMLKIQVVRGLIDQNGELQNSYPYKISQIPIESKLLSVYHSDRTKESTLPWKKLLNILVVTADMPG